MNFQASWDGIPDDSKGVVIGYLDYKTRCNLRKCSKTSRPLVDSCPLHLAKLALVIDTLHVRIHILATNDWPVFIHYHKHQMGTQLKIITRDTLREKTLESKHFLRVALCDFEILARNRKLNVDFIAITCKEGWYLEQLKAMMGRTPGKMVCKKFWFTGETDHSAEFRKWIDAGQVKYHKEMSLEQIIANSNAAMDSL